MTFSRRTFLLGGLGAAGAYAASRTPLAQKLIDYAASPLETALGGHSPTPKSTPENLQVNHDAQDLVSRLKGLIRRPTIDYREVFIAYNQIINDAQNFEQKSSTESERLTYTALRTIALMYQADLLVNKAGNNVVKSESIRLTGFDDTTASRRATDSFYNKLKALENYETVMRINDDVEKEGHRLPKSIPQMGLFGDIASRNFVNKKMYEVVTKLLETPNLPEQYIAPFRRRAYELAQLNLAQKRISN